MLVWPKELTWEGALALSFGALGGTLSGIFYGFAPVLQLLVLLMAADFVLGLGAAGAEWARHDGPGWSSQKAWLGLIKKGATFFIVVMAGVIQRYVMLITASSWQLPLITMFAGGFCVVEIISLAENAGRCGVPIHKNVVAFLRRMDKGLKVVALQERDSVVTYTFDRRKAAVRLREPSDEE